MLPLVAGATLGLGVLVLLRTVFPPRPALATVLERLEHPAPHGPSAEELGLLHRRLQGLTGFLEGLGVSSPRLRSDLRAVAKPLERHLGDKILTALLGALVPPAMAGLAALGGVSVGVVVPAWAALGLGVGGFFVPDVALRSQAAERRASFRFALGSFFDLVVISLAGGAGVEAALYDAAHSGEGWAYGQLQRALGAARLTRETPWVALGRLGEELGVDELGELAASVGLAATEGARVGESLVSKARSLRAHELAEAESVAQSASERMSIPVVLLFVGFLIFLAYPAVTRILTGI